MVNAISSSTTPRIKKPHSAAPHRPPLSPSAKPNTNNNADNSFSRKQPPHHSSKHIITSRYLHSPSPSSSTPAPETPRPSLSAAAATTRSLSVSFQDASFSFQTARPKPARTAASSALARRGNSLTKSLDCSSYKKGPVLAAAVRVLRHSVVFDHDKVKRAAFDGDDVYLASDSDSSNSGSNEGGNSVRGRAVARGISVPARFMPESFTPAKKPASVDVQLASPRLWSSIRGVANPEKVQASNVPSIHRFAAEARREKKGESRIEEAHSLRLLYNRYLQWRCVNARLDAALSAQKENAEKNMYNAWLTISELREAVTNKRIELQLVLQNLKLASILKGQMNYVEEWSSMDREHCQYLSGLFEALRASTLRLPVVSGARVDIQELKNAVNSAVDVMQAMGSSIWSLLPMVERPKALASELAKAAAHERALLDQLKGLLSIVSDLHVKQCSLHGQILQFHRNPSLVQL